MIMAFVIVYFRNLGLTFFQISIITSVYGVTLFLFEVPTGAFADTYSRKYSVIVGFVLAGVSVTLIPFFTSFYALLALWCLAAIGMTFISGAEESWVIGNLNYHKRRDLHQEFFIKSQSIMAFGAIIAPLAGAILAKEYSLRMLWWVFGSAFLLNSVFLSLFAEEKYRPRRASVSEALRRSIGYSKEGLRLIRSNTTLFLLVLGALFTGLMAVGGNGWQPFLVELQLPEYALGFVYSVLSAAVMISPFLSRLFMNMKVKNAVSIILVVRTALLFSLLFVYPPLFLVAAAIFVLNGSLDATTDPLLQTYFHKFVPERIRATVVSAKSMIGSVVMVVPVLVAGFLLDAFGPQKVLALTGLFGIFAVITYQKIKD
jgi:MFS family permease